MNEMMPGVSQEVPEGENIFEELAHDFGLRNVIFPKVGTEAYRRLRMACQNYSKEVHMEMVGRETDLTALQESQSKRRVLHNQLCIMVFGLDHAAVERRDYKDLQRVANMAHALSGREQYITEV